MTTKISLRRRTGLMAMAIGLLTLGASHAFADELQTALADLYPAKTGFAVPTIANATATEIQNAIQLIASPAGTTVSVTSHGSHAGLNDPTNVSTYITEALANVPSSGFAAYSTEATDALTGAVAGLNAQGATVLSANIDAVVEAAANQTNFARAGVSDAAGKQSTLDTDEEGLINYAFKNDSTKSDFTGILTAALLTSDTNGAGQAAIVDTVASTTAGTGNLAIAGTTLQAVGTAIASTDSSVLDTGNFLITVAVKQTLAANAQALIQGFAANETLGQMETTAATVATAADTTSAVTATQRANVFAGLYAAASASSFDLTALTHNVTTSFVSAQTYSSSEATNDTAQQGIVAAFTKIQPTQFTTILTSALSAGDSNPVAQANLVDTEATSTNLAGTTLSAVATAIAAADSSAITNPGLFLATITEKQTAAAGAEAFLEGFTSTESASQLATTATQIAANAGSIVPVAGGAATPLSNTNLQTAFVGLSNSTNGSSAIAGITTGLLADTALTDVTKATVANLLITDGSSSAAVIAGAAATTLSSPVADLYAFTTTILGSTDITKSTTGSATDIAHVTTAIANEFAIASITDPSDTGLAAKVAATQAGIIKLPAQAGAILADVANQVLTNATYLPSSPTPTQIANITTFATNLITGVDTNVLVGGKAIGITDALRSSSALGLAQAYDTAGVSAAAVITAAAVSTDSANYVAISQPILLSYATSSSHSTETTTIAQKVIEGVATGTLAADTATANLVLGAKATSSTLSTPEVQAIVKGASTDSTITGSYTGGSSNVDQFLTYVMGDLDTKGTKTTGLPALNIIAPYFSSDTADGFSDTSVAVDVVNATYGNFASGNGAFESSSLLQLIAGQHASDAGVLAGDAAAAYQATSGATYANENAIATGIINGAGLTYSAQVSGSVAAALNSESVTGSALAALKGNLVTAVIKNIPTALATSSLTTYNADVLNVALKVAQTIPENDPSGTLTTDITTVTNAAIGALATASKTAANVYAITSNVIANYTGALSSNSGNALGYVQAAAVAGSVSSAQSSVSGLTSQFITNLIPAQINANGNDPAAAALIAQAFVKDLPAASGAAFASNAYAIEAAATAGSLYGNNLTASQAATIGVDIASSLPTADASTGPALSGSLAVLVANAAKAGGDAADDNFATVAGVFATSSLPVGDATTIATDLAAASVAANPSDAEIPAIVAAFVNAPNGIAVNPSGTATVTNYINALVKLYPLQALDILGYAIGGLPSGAAAGTAASLKAGVYTTLTGLTGSALSSLEAALGVTTTTALKLALENTSATGLLDKVYTDATTGFVTAWGNSYSYGSVDTDETPVVSL